MNNNLIYQIIIGLLVSFSVVLDVNAQENFKGIIPMITTKAEVEKILGKPNKYGDYELEEGRVHVDYYERECEKKIGCFCLAPLGTVRYTSVELYYDLYLKDLNLDPQKFKESHDSHLDVFSYSNSKTGVVYEVQDGKVTHIYYNESEDTCSDIKQKFSKPNNQNNFNTQDNFKGIIPMVTTKSEVEKKLGKPDKNGAYELDEGRVFITYYNLECEKKIECFCLAPLGTVQSMKVTLYYDLYLKDLNLDPKVFERKVIDNDPLFEIYSNSKSGLVYEVWEGKVSQILYFESEDTCNSIKQKFLKPESQNKSNDSRVPLYRIASSNAQENFKGIIPMITTKTEVEKKLGKPNKYGDYELDEGRVHIDYYERKCEENLECFCLAPLGTVRFINIELYYDLYLKDLNLDPQKFKETRSSHLLDVFTYSNSKTGVVYEVYEGKVSHIYYYESEDTCNSIKQKFLKPNSQNKLNNTRVSLFRTASSNVLENFRGKTPIWLPVKTIFDLGYDVFNFLECLKPKLCGRK